MILKNSFLLLITLLLVACGEYQTIPLENTNPPNPTATEPPSPEQEKSVSVTLSGKVTYDFVPFRSGLNNGLDYEHMVKKPVRGVVVQVIDRSGEVLKTTHTDEQGDYTAKVTAKQVKIRVLAKMYQAPSVGKASWDFQVKDNTNSNALYVMDGRFANLGEGSTQTRNLNAASGWGGNGYTSTRVAAPFAILDVVYQAIEKVKTAQSDALFPPLNIFWSKNNLSASGDTNLGQIITSHYNGDETALYILGKANSDTDEYDSAVIAHEWGHYYESAFSRSDSIGGSHGNKDMLDIRLAFGEGFGTAMGCIIIDSPLYIDSLGDRQKQSFGDDLEQQTPLSNNPGWFNEASVYRILYDIYDANNEAGDGISFGFTPIHDVFINAQKNTPAFTSIFTFITALKAEQPGNESAIDEITAREQIAPITDIYGSGRVNRKFENANPLYYNLAVGGSVNITTDTSATATSYDNRLGAYDFIKFTIDQERNYRFNIRQISGHGTPDPDMFIYKGSEIQAVASTEAEGETDSIEAHLKAGVYRMAITVYNNRNKNIFELTLD